MKAQLVVIGLLAAATANVEAQVSARDNNRQIPVNNRRVAVTQRNDRSCANDVRELQRQRALLQQQLRREHQEWHARHNNDRDYVRSHNALHDRLQRTRETWERRNADKLKDCFDNRSGDRWDNNDRWDDDNRRNDHDWDDRRYDTRDDKYDRKLEKLDEKREQWDDKRDARMRRSN
jgi:hypothetical protein